MSAAMIRVKRESRSAIDDVYGDIDLVYQYIIISINTAICHSVNYSALFAICTDGHLYTGTLDICFDLIRSHKQCIP